MRSDVVINTLAGVKIIVVAAIVSALEFVVSISYFVDMLAEVVVDPSIDALAGAITVFVSDIDVEVLADVNVNIFAFSMTAVEFAMPKPLAEFSC